MKIFDALKALYEGKKVKQKNSNSIISFKDDCFYTNNNVCHLCIYHFDMEYELVEEQKKKRVPLTVDNFELTKTNKVYQRDGKFVPYVLMVPREFQKEDKEVFLYNGYSFHKDGRFYINDDSPGDLFIEIDDEEEKKEVRYINIYKQYFENNIPVLNGYIYKSEEEAKFNSSNGYIKTIKIEF